MTPHTTLPSPCPHPNMVRVTHKKSLLSLLTAVSVKAYPIRQLTFLEILKESDFVGNITLFRRVTNQITIKTRNYNASPLRILICRSKGPWFSSRCITTRHVSRYISLNWFTQLSKDIELGPLCTKVSQSSIHVDNL